VVSAAFVLAVFGWGIGFYGPPIYLQVIRDAREWPLSLISTAVTVHFLVGAVAVANLPVLYRRYGLARVTAIGAIALALGVFGWACATVPWQLFAATLLSGIGWAAMGGAAVNAIVSPWFMRARPAALATAYNGASVGGVIFLPLWVAAIGAFGFQAAAGLIGIFMAITIWILAARVFSRTPEQMGLTPDGDAPDAAAPSVTSAMAQPLPGSLLWRNVKFTTLAAGMALGLFAQVGLLAHLFSLLVPALGAQPAGLAMGLATACAIGGRTLVGWLMPAGADRRLVASASNAVQIAGATVFMVAGQSVALLILGVVLFGVGIGNVTSLPPLIAQVEFVKEDVQRVVALIIAIGQGTFAFAPALFGLIREATPGDATLFFAAVALVQGLSICAFLAGRDR
jgi:hypothetical protein